MSHVSHRNRTVYSSQWDDPEILGSIYVNQWKGHLLKNWKANL